MRVYAHVLAIPLFITALIAPSVAFPGSLTHRSTDAGPLRTCYETTQADKNWFAIAWKSGDKKDKATCKGLKLLLMKEADLSGFKCYWYWNDTMEEGLTKVTGYLKRKEGKMQNALTKPVETLWGEGSAKACMFE